MDRLVREYGTMVLKQAFFYLKDKQKAEDVCQEVFLRIYKKQPKLPDERSERAYLLRVTINLCKDVLKSAWSRRVLPMAEGFDAPSSDPGPETELIASEERVRIYDAVLELPPIYKDVILLFYYHDLPAGEVARVLRIPEVTVRTRLMRARNRLAAALEGKKA
ncbi:MAG: sigma-70 family RNA polymerase sigma factor [Christensenellaceae bacterium]|jgi:RNA polymerase sigma-70 factor (ECF subfamily)|nr:sigma-70 family RNA polymerase sigma factor [Christensenellaceae bacterium]